LIEHIFFNHKICFVFIVDFPASADHILKNCNGGTLAIISKAFWNSLHSECSGRLRTGELVKYFEIFFDTNVILLDLLMEVKVVVTVLQKFLDH